MKKQVILIGLIIGLFLILVQGVFGEVRINEVMVNPDNSYDEWIEIYNPNNITLNLSEWFIEDLDKPTSISCEGILNCSLIINSTYFIIIGKKANISSITNNTIFYFNASNVSRYWLNNPGESIFLYNQTYLVDNLTYPDFSLLKGITWQSCNNSWIEENPTPGLPNNCSSQSELPQNQTEEQEEEDEPELYLEIDWNDEEIINGNDFKIEIKAYNLDDDNYNIKVWIEFEDNDTVISDRYDEANNSWKSGRYYVDNFFTGPGDKTGEVLVRIRDDYEDFSGYAKIFFRIKDETSIDSLIEILEKDSEVEESISLEITENSELNNSEDSLITGGVIKLGKPIETRIEPGITKTYENIVYRSKNKKIKDYSILGFALLCVVLSILLINNKL